MRRAGELDAFCLMEKVVLFVTRRAGRGQDSGERGGGGELLMSRA